MAAGDEAGPALRVRGPERRHGNLKKAEDYGIEVVDQAGFWPRLCYRLDQRP